MSTTSNRLQSRKKNDHGINRIGTREPKVEVANSLYGCDSLKFLLEIN